MGRAASWGLLGAICACAPRAPAPADVPTRAVVSDELALSVEVPEGWVDQLDGDALVLSGPRGEQSYYTTVTLQRLDSPLPLERALEEAYAPAAAQRSFAWLYRQGGIVLGHPAVHYSMRFELHESPRIKVGTLIGAPIHMVDVSYSATEALYARGLPAYEHVLQSLSLF